MKKNDIIMTLEEFNKIASNELATHSENELVYICSEIAGYTADQLIMQLCICFKHGHNRIIVPPQEDEVLDKIDITTTQYTDEAVQLYERIHDTLLPIIEEFARKSPEPYETTDLESES